MCLIYIVFVLSSIVVAHDAVIICVLGFYPNDSLACFGVPPPSIEIFPLGISHVQLAW